MDAPIFVTAKLAYSNMLKELDASQTANLSAIPFVENPYTMKLCGAIPIGALEAAKAAMEFHTGQTPHLHTGRFSVDIVPPVDSDSYTVIVTTKAHRRESVMDESLSLATDSNAHMANLPLGRKKTFRSACTCGSFSCCGTVS